MKSTTSYDRRSVLQMIAGASTLAFPGWALGANSIWVPDDLSPTPQQTEGPFYPQPTIEQQMFNDTDLIRKLGKDIAALGQKCLVLGSVKNQQGKPIEGAIVEIWQACSSGRYNHASDKRNPSPLDKNFQFWGRVLTGKDGTYVFKTIVPGKYPGRTARHIHYRVDAKGYKRCSTQSFFSDYGDDNMKDGIYRGLNRKDREALTIEFDKPTTESIAKPQTKQGSEKKSEAKDKRKAAESATKKKEQPATTEKSKLELPKETFWKGQFDLILVKK